VCTPNINKKTYCNLFFIEGFKSLKYEKKTYAWGKG